MENTEFAGLLSADLGTEFQSIIRYVHHVATIKGAEYRSIAEELGNHLGQELDWKKGLNCVGFPICQAAEMAADGHRTATGAVAGPSPRRHRWPK